MGNSYGRGSRHRVVQQVEHWRDELIALSRRNRVLYFKPTKSATLVFEAPSLARVVQQLQRKDGKWYFYEPPDRPEGDADNSEAPEFRPLDIKPLQDDELLTQRPDRRTLLNALRLLERKSTQEFMDKGLWVLYLAAGFLHWIDPEDEASVKTPILLIPVRVDRVSPRDRYHLVAAEDDVIVNPAMLTKLEGDFDVNFPALDEGADPGLLSYLDRVEAAVKGRGWSVARDGALDSFSFHKEVMYRDLLNNVDTIADHPLVQALALGADARPDFGFDPPREEDLDELFPPEETTTILDADASQRRCLAVAGSGSSFVMDGPPGTGKSQTIANLIAQGLAQGKSILFVSEKIAALEVVKARLDAAGLGEYLLEMHSHKATRKEVAQTLYRALTMHPRVPASIGADSVRKLKERRRDLSAYAEALNQRRQPLGRTLHETIGRVSQLHGVEAAPLPEAIGSDLSAATLVAILDSANSLSRAWNPVERNDTFFWHGLTLEFTSLGGKRRLEEMLHRCEAAVERLRGESTAICSSVELWWNDAPWRAATLIEVADVLARKVDIPEHWLSVDDFEEVRATAERLSVAWSEWGDSVSHLEEIAGTQWRSISRSFALQASAAVDGLESLQPGWDPMAMPVEDLETIASFIPESVDQIQRLSTLAAELATGMGLRAHSITLERAESLASLADLIGAVKAPEAQWLDPLALGKLEEAHSVLQKLVEASRRKAGELKSIFTPDVLELDLENLRARFDELHRGFRKLGAAYRADKRLLGSTTRTGKVTKATIAALPSAIEWKALKADLAMAENRHSDTLGDHYYQGERTDFDDVSEAIDVARRALELAGQQLSDSERFRHQFARTGTPDAFLRQLASETHDTAARWRRDCRILLGPIADQLQSMELSDLTRWLDTASQPTLTLAMISRQTAEAIGQALPLDAISALLEERTRVEDVEEALEATWQTDTTLLGGSYQAMRTDWDSLLRSVSWASELRRALGGPVDDVTADRLVTVDIDASPLREQLGAWRRSRDELAGTFVSDRGGTLVADLDANFEDARQIISDLRSSMGDIEEWAAYVGAVADLKTQGLDETVEFMVKNTVAADRVPMVVERAVLEAWIDRILTEDDRLDSLRSTDRDALVEDFRNLDRRLIESMSSQIIQACNGRRPQTRVGVAGIIEREGQKKRRHMPVRLLIQQTAEVAQALKPCFMMSPLSVSQFLESDIRFDLVIFDEASQVKPADAVNCIYRGRQLIVAGDQKQLPPTAFFDRVTMDGDEEYQEDAIDEFESVLDLSKAGGLPALPLRWHYRSQHEHLITYSNYSFYDGRLVTFPGAQQQGADIGIELFKVDGEYRRGGARDNLVEAEAVAERVLFHALQHPKLTMGVVAFSEAQASTIEYVLDQKRRNHPDLDYYFTDDRLTGFFVKNLENVQGDERDIMIFSIGYGPDENGKTTMNFGPLNVAGGERRLNVAITRARRRVEVVTSILPEDFSHTGSAGPRHLRRYLDFALRGMPALAIEVDRQTGDVESPFEEEVLRVVRSWGFDAIPQVGVADYRIDLGVIDPDVPGRFALGLECDGAMYHSSPVARDRDRLRQEVLERLGWKIYRIWGPAWYRDRNGEEQRLRQVIETALNRQRHESNPGLGGAASRPTPVLQSVDLNAPSPWAEDYRVVRPKVARHAEFHEPRALPDIEDAIFQVTKGESPISTDLLLQRVREAWRIQRAGARTRAAFESGLARAKRSGHITLDRYGFVWRTNQSLRAVRIPTDDPDSIRTVANLPREELRLAVLKLVEDARLVDWDELTIAVARLFGWSRRGSDIARGLDDAVKYLLKNGDLRRQGDQITRG